MKVLVVYFSRTGATRRLAERLARELGGTAMAIAETRARRGLLGYQRSLFEAVSGFSPPIEPPPHDPSEFDLVLIGTPVWGWRPSSPVRAFMRRWGRKLRRVALSCTMGRSGDRRTFDELRRLLGRPPVAELALTAHEVAALASPPVRVKVDRFVKRLDSTLHLAEARTA